MGEKLRNAPVFLTAAQIRHNPILSFDGYAAPLQEQFRKMGYPDYRVRAQPGFEVDVSSSSGIQVKAQETRQHSYLNRSGSACFVLENSRLYFQVTEYDVFDTFRSEVVRGLELLHSVVALDYIDSVSMRLLDAIVPSEHEDLSDYVAKELLGIGKVLDDATWRIIHSAFEANIRTPEHKIVVRTLARRGKLATPPDLNIEGMKLMPRFAEINSVHVVLDTDCVYEQRDPFDVSNVSRRLRLLKDDLRTTFHAAVTKDALARWS